MVIDYTITIGNLIEIGSIVGGGILVLLTLKSDVRILKLGAVQQRKEAQERSVALKEELSQMQNEIKKIGEVLITQADQNRRILHLEEDVRELRHGRGFIRTATTGGGVDGEY
jgi:Tfp pilus assembly protein PilN